MAGQLTALQVVVAQAAEQSEAEGATIIEAAVMYVKEAVVTAAAAEPSGSEAAAGARRAVEPLEVAGAQTTAVQPEAVYASEAEATQVLAAAREAEVETGAVMNQLQL